MTEYVIIDDKNKVIRRICCTPLNVPEDGPGVYLDGLSIVTKEYYDKHPKEGYRELGLFDTI